jgi:hypothetical protein
MGVSVVELLLETELEKSLILMKKVAKIRQTGSYTIMEI